MSKDEKKVGGPKNDNGATEKIKGFFVNNWRMLTAIGVSVACTAAVSAGIAVAVSDDAPTRPAVSHEHTKGLGVFYYDTGIEEYQITLADDGKATFVVGGEVKLGTYSVDGTTLKIKLNGERGERVATINGDVLEITYNGGQFRFLKKVHYTVSYDEMGGSAVADQMVVSGKTFSSPANPTKPGYEFIGWYMDSDFTTPFMFGTQIVTNDITLYANWALVDMSVAAYTIDFDLGYDAEAPAAMETMGGKLYGAPQVEREGYNFCGWWISAYEDGTKLTYKYTPDTVFTANTTLFAVWESKELGSKLSAPEVEVTDNAIVWGGVSGVSIYRLKVTGPEGFLKIDEDVAATSYPLDFSAEPAGDYNIELTAIAPNAADNSDTVKRSYINKAVGRVSQFTVLDGKVLLFNRVENAENYYITVECGDESHNHTMYDNGDSTYYNFLNCEMKEGGIRFTVTATADGYASTTSETFVYNRSLDKVEGLMVDEETQMLTWSPVKNATNYIVSISCGNLSADHKHEYIDVGNKTSFSLKECANMKGGIIINVYPKTNGYNSPAPTEYTYVKTKLAAPMNIALNNVAKHYVLTWDAIIGTLSPVEYVIKIGDSIFTTTDTSYDLTDAITWVPAEKYAIEVKARTATKESAWSDAVNVHYYEMSDKLTYKSGVVSWKPVIGATAYEVKVNDGSVIRVEDSFANITLTQEGTNTIYVRFIDEAANYYPATWASYEVKNVLPIMFDSRGGSEVDMQYKATGDYVELPTPTRTGYDFAGWYNTPKGPDSNGAKYENGYFTSNSELFLYAYWTPAAQTLTYANVNAPGQGKLNATSGMAVYTKDYKLDVPVLDDPTMVFLGWFAGTGSTAEQLTDDRGYSLKPWAQPNGATVYAQYVSNVLEFNLLEDGTYSVVRGLNASKLTTITIPAEYNSKPVTVVDGYAFRSCTRLVSVYIPDTVTIVSEETAFEGCKKLEELNVYHVDGVNQKLAPYSSIDGVLLHRNDITGSMELSYYPQGKTGAYAIPNVVTEIPLRLFEGTQVTEVTIPTSVTIIRSGAFINCSTLEKVIFEEGGAYELVIEDGAFRDCTGLKSITLPARLSQLAVNEETHTMDIFAGCTSLTHINVERGNQVYASNDGVITDKAGTTLIFCPTARKGSYTIPSGIETIGDYAFVNCIRLTEIVVPGYVETIGAHAFEGCLKVARIRFTAGAVTGMSTSIGEYAFAGLKALKTIDFEEGSAVASIGAYAFTGATGLRRLVIPASMMYIGDYAFEKAEGLGEVAFQNGNEGSLEFGNYVFSECIGLTRIELPKSVTKLNLGVFDGCVNISEVKVDAGNDYYKDIDGVVFSKDGKELVFFPKGKKPDANGEYVIPDGVEIISEAAFRGMFHVEKIVIKNTITSIGKYAFQDSMSLKTLEFEAGNDEAKLIIDDEAFAGCAAITAVALPARTQIIGKKAFYSVSMSTLTFPAGLESIGDYAFARTAITSIVIPASATLGESVFDTCTKLTDVSFAAGYQATSIPVGTFKGTAITAIEIPASITSIGYAAFNECDKLARLTFEEGGTAALAIGVATTNEDSENAKATGVFLNCKALTDVNLPDRVSYIGEFAFSGCSSLKTFTIGENSTLERIGKSAFNGCIALNYIYIPKTVQNTPYVDDNTSQEFGIGEYAFNQTGLTNVEFAPGGTGELSIGRGAFANCGGIIGYQDGKAGPEPIYDYMKVINLPNRIAPIYLIYQDGNVGIYSETRDGISREVFIDNGITALQAINVEEGGKYYGSHDGALYKLAEKDGEYVKDALMMIPAYSAEQITIPYTVSMLGYNNANVVQKDNSNTCYLKSVVFEATPDDVEPVELYVGRNAFTSVTSLTSFEFPERLVGIGVSAFSGTRLTSVHLPSTLRYFDTEGNGAMEQGSQFKNITTLTSLTFAEGIQIREIPNSAFYGCSKITTLTIPASVVEIGTYAFRACPVTSLAFEEGSQLKVIHDGAFYGFKLTELTLPDNVATLDGQVFQSMTNLTKLVLPAAFNSFTTVINGQNRFLFNNLTKLNTVEVNENNPNFKSIDGVVYTKDGTELVYYPRAKAIPNSGAFVTPAGVQSIGSYAFYQKTDLKKLTLSKDLMYINYQAFYNCSYLTSLTFEERQSPLNLGDYAFYNCTRLNGVMKEQADGSKKNVFEIPESVKFEGTNCFANCFKTSVSNLYVVFLGENESTSMINTFYGAGMVGVENIPVNLSTMNQTFNGCTKLHTVTFNEDANGIISVMAGTFKGCTALKSISLPAIGALMPTSSSIGSWTPGSTGFNGAFQGCTKLTSVTIEECNTIGGVVFMGCTKLTSVTIPDGVASIGIGAFYGCTALKEVKIPGTVESIERQAFMNCSALQAIDIPDFVSIIGTSTFEGCKALETVTLGSSITTIETKAFYGVSKMTEIVFPMGIETIGDYAFYGCSSLQAIDIPGSIRTIGESAFADCSNVTTITVADGLEFLGNSAFAGAALVEEFNIPSTLVELGVGVFDGWSSLKNLTANGNLDYAFKDGILYNATYTKMIFVSSDITGELVIPETVTSLGEGLFANTAITSVVLPDTIREIPARAFLNCRNLVNVKMPSALESIGERAFAGCVSLKTITIPKTVHSVYNKIEYVSPYDPLMAGYYLDKAHDGIGHGAFYGCTALENVIFEEGGAKRLSFGDFAFYGCTSLKGTLNETTGEYEFVIPSRVRGDMIPTYAYVAPGHEGSGEAHQRSEQGIGMYTFARCTALENVIFEEEKGIVMPEKLYVSIGAFQECTALKSVTFSSALQNYELTLAGGKGGLMTYTITAIGENAFKGCTSLTTVNFPADTSKIYAPESAFDKVPARISITMVPGSDGMDYGGGKADWQMGPSNIFTIDGCGIGCKDCQYYKPHEGLFYNDVFWAEDFI